MIEPLDDELRALVGALRDVERPTAAARAATWAAVAARTAGPVDLPARPARSRLPATLLALAAAVALCLGLAAAIARRGPAPTRVEAIHNYDDSSPQRPAQRTDDSPAQRQVEAGSHDAPAPSQPPEPPAPTPLATCPDGHASCNMFNQPSIDPTGPAPSTAPAATRRRPRPAASPSLRPEEVASFQRAQAALAEARDEDALRALDEHARRFPDGLFEEERLVSRATALCRLGRTEEARSARDRFLRQRPTSHLAGRMRQICREIE